MRAAPLTLLFLLYVGLDLANPHMPGAFEFEVHRSVDGVGAARAALDASRPLAAVPVRPHEIVVPPAPTRRVVGAVRPEPSTDPVALPRRAPARGPTDAPAEED
jgi:hypothetical protein